MRPVFPAIERAQKDFRIRVVEPAIPGDVLNSPDAFFFVAANTGQYPEHPVDQWQATDNVIVEALDQAGIHIAGV